MTDQKPKLQIIFPSPVYNEKRDSNLTPREEKGIGRIVKEGMNENFGNFTSNNRYIFKDDKLKKIKQFFEQQLKIYVEKVINPAEELDFYITQSWLNITKPGGYHHEHFHANSIISGVFYISTVEDDKIEFKDPNSKVKTMLHFQPREYNIWNSATWALPVNTNELILFPSYIDHQVKVNEKATTDRISLSFNTFARGIWGRRKDATELILK